MRLVLRTISAERFGDMCIETGSAIGIGRSLFTSIQETKLMAGGKIPPNGDHQRPWPVFRSTKKLEGNLLLANCIPIGFAPLHCLVRPIMFIWKGLAGALE